MSIDVNVSDTSQMLSDTPDYRLTHQTWPIAIENIIRLQDDSGMIDRFATIETIL